MYKNESISSIIGMKIKFCPWDVFAPEIFIGNWAVHYFMHGILIHETLRTKFSFSCVEISFSFNGISIHGNFVFMHKMFVPHLFNA